MPTPWIDFKELRTRASISTVLAAYNLDLRIRGDRATGFCPLPCHTGERKSPSFSVHLTKNLFNCFSCHRGGNCIDLVVLLDGLDPSKPTDVRKAAIKLANLCRITMTAPKEEDRGSVGEKEVESRNTPKRAGPARKPLTVAIPITAVQAESPDLKIVVNPPLDFVLTKLDADHAYLRDRGLTKETIATFGLGYCSRGMLNGRIAIPLHDADGRLIGYGGRLVDNAAIDAEHPRYLFPGERIKNGVKHVFAKGRLLYNGHRLKTPLKRLIIVEGFASVWWLHQNGIESVVALMGSDCSDEQADLIARLVDNDGVVTVLSDGDPAGMKGAEQTVPKISARCATRWHRLAENRQPTDLTADELKTMFLPAR